jgi:hypothetical protein
MVTVNRRAIISPAAARNPSHNCVPTISKYMGEIDLKGYVDYSSVSHHTSPIFSSEKSFGDCFDFVPLSFFIFPGFTHIVCLLAFQSVGVAWRGADHSD